MHHVTVCRSTKLQENTQCKAQRIYRFRTHTTMINHQQYNVTDVQIWTDRIHEFLNMHYHVTLRIRHIQLQAQIDFNCLDYSETCY